MNSEQAENYLLSPNTPFDSLKIHLFEALVTNMTSSDPSVITQANSLITKFRTSSNLFANINVLLEGLSSNQAVLYALMMFDEQLTTHWGSLAGQQKDNIRGYMFGLYNKIQPTEDNILMAVYKKIKTIIVRIFTLNYSPGDTFVEDLLTQARSSQFKCETVLDIFAILGEEIEAESLTGFEDKYSVILTLGAMVLQSSQETKVKSNLIRNSLVVL